MTEPSQGDATLDEHYGIHWARSGPDSSTARFLADHSDAVLADQIDVLLLDQLLRWRNGCPKPVEDYLLEHTSLAGQSEVRLRLIQGEFVARLELDTDPDPAVYIRRFPDLAEEIRTQCEVDRWLNVPDEPAPDPARATTVDSTMAQHHAAFEVTDADAPLRESDFQIVRSLGAGGMGEVFEAVQKSLRKSLAIKVMHRDALDSPSRVRRFITEAHALARLKHSNIVGVHGIGRMVDGRCFLVMDLVAGGETLSDLIKASPLPFERAAALVATIAEAIEHAHGRGVVHRDLKPSNVLLDPAGTPCVTDFGLAKVFDQAEPDHPPTTADQILGTPHYMSPEQADPARGPITPRTDVYGLGGLLYALLTGKPPIQGDSITHLLTQVVSPEPVHSPRDWRDEIPSGLERICLKCLSKESGRRYGTAREVTLALQAWRAEPEPRQSDPPPAVETDVRREPQHAWGPDPSVKHNPRRRDAARWASKSSEPRSRSRRRLMVGGALVTLLLAFLVVGPIMLVQRTLAPPSREPIARETKGKQSLAMQGNGEARSQGSPPPSPAPRSIPPAPADTVASWELHVYRPREDSKTWQDLGDALTSHISVQVQDRLKLRATFHEPVFPTMFAINPDGSVQRLKTTKDDQPGQLTQELTVPSGADRYIRLTDPGTTGFVLLASRGPLPDQDRPVASVINAAAWRGGRPETTFVFDGRLVLPVMERRVAEESVGPGPFRALCENLKSRSEITAVRAVVVDVQPRVVVDVQPR